MEDKNIGYLLKMTSNSFKHKVDSSEVFLRHPEINQPSYFILQYLDKHSKEDIYQKDFKKLFGFKNPTITEMLTNLENCGYIQRLKENSDGRLRRVVLTAKGKNLNSEIHDEFKKVEETIYKLFSKEEYQKLCEDLNKLRNYLEGKND